MNSDMLPSRQARARNRAIGVVRVFGLVGLAVSIAFAPAQIARARNAVVVQAPSPATAPATPVATTPTLPSNIGAPFAGRVAAITIVASAKTAVTPAYDSPTATKPFTTFNNKTNFSGRHVFIVLAQQGDSFKVLLPMRPNGRTGYVKVKDVNLYKHDYAAVVSLSAKTLTLYKAGAEVLKDTVAVGSAKYPTPLGSFFMRELARPRNPKGAYGPWAFGLSAYSNVLQTFGRGDGQIGIHGTNQPGLLGQGVSHGCIRMRNATIVKLANILPQGVPVEIVA